MSGPLRPATNERLIEVRPRIGTVVAQSRTFPAPERVRLLTRDVEQLTVEPKRLSISLTGLQDSSQ